MRQNIHDKFHTTINGKNTICGLRLDELTPAKDLARFNEMAKDEFWIKDCCKKCHSVSKDIKPTTINN